MLTDLRNVFADPFAAVEAARGCGCGKVEVGAGVVGGGYSVLEGARSPVLDVLVNDLAGVEGCCKPDGFRPLGSAGRAIVGGPLEGRLGLGSAVVILKPSKGYLEVAFWFRATTLILLCCRRREGWALLRVAMAYNSVPRTGHTSMWSAGRWSPEKEKLESETAAQGNVQPRWTTLLHELKPEDVSLL